MEADSFIQLVKQMRDNQKAYFKSRSQFYLNKSKELEREVDAAIEKHQAEKHGKQQDLF